MELGPPRGNYRRSRRRLPGQRLQAAAAEINWRRQRGRGRRRPEPRRAHIDRPRGRQLAEAAGAGAAVTGRRGSAGRGPRPAAFAAHRPAVHRELSQPPPLLSPQNAPHIALGPHLRPPFLGVPSALCQTPGEEQAGVRSFVSWVAVGAGPCWFVRDQPCVHQRSRWPRPCPC